MANVYDFRSGRSIKNINPQAVGEELERIRVDKGKLTADLVLEDAKNEDSPLHAAFEWDNDAAAHQHRLNQARRLIVSIRIINSPIQTSVPAFVSVRTPDRGRDYMPTIEAMNDEQLRARVLLEIKQFAEALQRRYAHFSEVADIIAGLKKQVG